MSECTSSDCSACGENCPSKREGPSFESLNERSRVKKVIGIVSGKGGVGKTLVTTLLAVTMRRRGYRTAVMDADVTGPSVPKSFGVHTKAGGDGTNIFPVVTKTGIELMSLNLLLKDETDPVVWRGPVISGVIRQFWHDVIWHDIDYMFIDMPPGTGDVPLTVFQSVPLDGVIVVTSPQQLVYMIVEKAVKMARMMNVDVIGLVENMSYFICPDCKKRHNLFGESKIGETAKRLGVNFFDSLPLDPALASVSDKGLTELFEGDYLKKTADMLEKRFPVDTRDLES